MSTDQELFTMSNFVQCSQYIIDALGIEAASFWSEAEKDIAESPMAKPERPKEFESWKLRVKSS